MFLRLLGLFRGNAVLGYMARLTVILVLALAGAPVSAQTDTLDLDAIEKHITKVLERDRVPGAAVAIVRSSEVLFLKGFGEDGRGRPVDEDTVFVIGSMSKAFTALAAMRLVEAGRVSLDTLVGSHLPELKNADGTAWQNITLARLLTHTSGLPARTPHVPTDATLAQHAEALAKVDLNNAEGARHVYSSGNYLLAARMLESVSGTPFDRLLRQQVLEPIGIRHAERASTVPDENRRSRGHRYWVVWPRPVDLPAEPGRLATASLAASAADMARFLQFQLGDGTWGGQPILSAAGLAEMQEGSAQGAGFTYGLGWRNVEVAGTRTVQHGGVLPSYQGKMIVLPEQDAGIVVLTNASSALPLPIRRTSHRLANEITLHLLGESHQTPHISYRTWLIVLWSALGMILLHQCATLARIALGRDPARRPLLNAIVDIAMVLAIVFVPPMVIGLSLRTIVLQTPDLAIWLAAMTSMSLCAATIRMLRAKARLIKADAENTR